MANSKISALTSATTPLAGTETLPIVQGGATVKTTVANITNGGGYAGSFTTLDSSGNTTLGDASTDTVRVNGYMGVGGAANIANALTVGSPTLSGTTQRGIDAATTFGTGATASVQQIRAISTLTTAGVYAEWIGLNVPQPQGTGYTLTNAYGLYIQDQTKGTNNYGITSLVSSGTNKYNIYASGTAQNYFAGSVGIGVTSPAVKFDVLGTVQAAAAATQDAVRLAGRAGGTGTFAVTLTPTTLTASRTLTLPDATTTVVGTDTTQTLTNKTLDSGILTGTLTAGGGVGTSGQFLQSTATGVQWAAATGVLAKSTSVFTSATAATYTAPANTQWVKITVVGFGGNGGGIVSQRGSGGGGGGVAIKWLAMTAGQTLIYTVGTAVTSTVISGTLIITTISAGGGNAGSSTAYAANAQGGGAGGAASGGDININGGTGGTSYGSSAAVATQVSGVGGNCPGFGSGGTNTAAAISNGNNGNGYGAGGSGSIGNTSVGLGTGGVIIFEAF